MTAYGRTTEPGKTFDRWAAVDWVRGTKTMREGALDAYDTIMVRMRYDEQITRDCKIEHNGTLYRIKSFRPDTRRETIQMTCTELDER